MCPTTTNAYTNAYTYANAYAYAYATTNTILLLLQCRILWW
jgi:hypothetical protein